jgi:phosphate transport system substrate-binding protein
MLVRWPIGTAVKGNDGVANAVRQTRNSIAYLEFAQALQSKLSYGAVQNRAGRFVAPGAAGLRAAGASAEWSSSRDCFVRLTDAPGEAAYPITVAVYILMHKATTRAKTRAALDFFRWSLEKGSPLATELGYMPLPAPLTPQLGEYWARTFKVGN